MVMFGTSGRIRKVCKNWVRLPQEAKRCIIYDFLCFIAYSSVPAKTHDEFQSLFHVAKMQFQLHICINVLAGAGNVETVMVI